MLYTIVIIVPWSNNNSMLESLDVKIVAALPFVKYQFPNWGQIHDRPGLTLTGLEAFRGGGIGCVPWFLSPISKLY